MDLTITIAIVILTVVMATYSAHISAQTNTQKSILWTMACLIVGLLIWQAFRTYEADKGKTAAAQAQKQILQDLQKSGATTYDAVSQLNKGLDAASKITPSRIFVSGLKYVSTSPGEPLVDVHYENKGEVTAEVLFYGDSRLIEAPSSKENENKLFSELLTKIKNDWKNSAVFSPGTKRFFTMRGPKLETKQLEELKNGNYTLYFFGRFIYRDKTGTYYAEFCGYPTFNSTAVFACKGHNN